jgi:SNF2 family DNA or RNA helicase
MPHEISLENFEKYLERNSFDRKAYQLEGVRWILKNEIHGVQIPDYDLAYRVKGGLIADEMGLGKTIQIIGAILCNFKIRTLIVLPYILLLQWQEIIKRTLGHNPLVYHGSTKKNISLENMKCAPIVLTTYGHISLHAKRPENILHKIKWHRVVLDESHHVKSSKTNVFKGLEKVKSTIKWLITGTPVHNEKNDLIRPLISIGLPNKYCQNVFSFKEKKQDSRTEFYKHFMENFMLRRTKEDVGIDLLACKEETIVVPWKNPIVRSLAKRYHDRLFQTPIFERLECDKDYEPQGMSDDEFILVSIIRSRQICIYPKMVDPEISDDCPKIYAIIEQINKNRVNGNLKIVFTSFRMEADIIHKKLSDIGFTVEIVDGRVNNAIRNQIFLKRPEVLILQIVSACEGLNLQSYNEIHITSPPWNPAIEQQAIARCHRIGQEKEVIVYRYKMENMGMTPSIDDYCMSLQDSKKKLAEIMIKGVGVPEERINMRKYAMPIEEIDN